MLGVAAFVALVVLSACGACGGGDSGPNSVEEDALLRVPGGLERARGGVHRRGAQQHRSVSVGPEETGVNLVTVGSFDVPVDVTSENLEQFRDDITAGVEQLFTQADGSIEEGPIPITVGGLDGYRFEGTSTTPVEGGGEVHTRSIQVYDGRTGFFINCQYAPDAQEEILAAASRSSTRSAPAELARRAPASWPARP